MFKIPTYDEIEKKETEFNAERKGISSGLFQKRKKLDSSEDLANTEAVQSEKPVSKRKSIEPTTSVTDNEAEMSEKIVENTSDKTGNDDDDDELLNVFISENKDIIENPSSQVKPSPAKFAVPAVPSRIKFDPKVKIQQADAPVQTRYHFILTLYQPRYEGYIEKNYVIAFFFYSLLTNTSHTKI